MILKPTADGLVIPNDFLDGVEEARLRRVGDHFVIVRLGKAPAIAGRDPGADATGRAEAPLHDPLWDLGRDPFPGGPIDGARDHDSYIYGNPKGDVP